MIRPRPVSLAAGVLGSVAVLAVAVLAVKVALVDSGTGIPCGTSITVAVSQEKQLALPPLGDRYSREHCTRVRAVTANSGAVLNLLTAGWKPDAVKGLDDQPAVWIPGSRHWVGLLQLRPDSRTKVVDGPLVSVTTTPMVLAVPQPIVDSPEWPKSLSWNEFFGWTTDAGGWPGSARWGVFKLGRTDPATSTVGLHAAIEAFTAESGHTPPVRAEDVTSSTVDAQIQRVESATVHYGDTVGSYLCDLASYDQAHVLADITAIPVEEKSVHDYNTNHQGDCDGIAKPAVPLVAVYPTGGTIWSDSPYAILDHTTPDQRRLAADFRAYLLEPQQQADLKCWGFRGPGDDHPLATEGTSCAVTGKPERFDRHGMRDVPPTQQPYPVPDTVAAIRTTWPTLRKSIKVLFVVDTSDSMGYLVDSDIRGPGTQTNRLDLVRDALEAATASFSDQDQADLWTFEGSGNDPRHPDRVDLAPMTADGRKTFQAKAEALCPRIRDPNRVCGHGITSLYVTTRAAYDGLTAVTGPNDNRIVVILTDGRDNFPAGQLTLAALTDQLKEQTDNDRNKPHPVRVYAIAYGAKADTTALSEIATSAGGDWKTAASQNDIVDTLRHMIIDIYNSHT